MISYWVVHCASVSCHSAVIASIPSTRTCWVAWNIIHAPGLLVCTLISENQGLEKSRSASNFRKISAPADLDFVLRLHLEKKLDLYNKPEKNPDDKLKKFQVCRTWNFSKVWNRPLFLKTLIFRNQGAD